MKKKAKWMLWPGLWVFFFFMVAFVAAAVVLALAFASLGLWLLSVFMVLLAVLNHKLYRECKHGSSDFH